MIQTYLIQFILNSRHFVLKLFFIIKKLQFFGFEVFLYSFNSLTGALFLDLLFLTIVLLELTNFFFKSFFFCFQSRGLTLVLLVLVPDLLLKVITLLP